MTPAQFARAVEVAGVNLDRPANQAAQLVLVDRETQSEAGRIYAIHRSAVLRSVKRIQAAAKACPCCGRAF